MPDSVRSYPIQKKKRHSDGEKVCGEQTFADIRKKYDQKQDNRSNNSDDSECKESAVTESRPTNPETDGISSNSSTITEVSQDEDEQK